MGERVMYGEKSENTEGDLEEKETSEHSSQ